MNPKYLRNKIKVLESRVDTYNIGRFKGLKEEVFHSPCEIALLCFSIDHAEHHKELITELRDVKMSAPAHKGNGGRPF